MSIKPGEAHVDTATIIVHGVNGPWNGQPTGWSKGFQRDLQASAGAASSQEDGLRGPSGMPGTLSGARLNHDFYEFNWGGFSFAAVGLYPIESVHQMAFVHLQMAQMLVWMKGYDKMNVISHSWGTLLSYDLMNSGGIEMHHWVTLGSPLKSSADKPVWNTGNWINGYSLNDPVVHYEVFPPFPSFTQMASSVIQSIFGGPGLTINRNVDVQHAYIMGKFSLLEHIAYWNWAPCVNDIRNDLQ